MGTRSEGGAGGETGAGWLAGSGRSGGGVGSKASPPLNKGDAIRKLRRARDKRVNALSLRPCVPPAVSVRLDVLLACVKRSFLARSDLAPSAFGPSARWNGCV